MKFIYQDRKFIGYLMSSLAWSEPNQRWEIVDLRNDQVIATKAGSKEYPLGVHQWQFENKSCHDPQSNVSRTLKFHLAVEEPGMFCCSDGFCFNSELVCDNVEHCQDGADEQHCQLVHAGDKKAYNPSIPPFGFDLKNDVKVAKPLIINSSVEIFEILHVDESVAKFSLLFRYYMYNLYSLKRVLFCLQSHYNWLHSERSKPLTYYDTPDQLYSIFLINLQPEAILERLQTKVFIFEK